MLVCFFRYTLEISWTLDVQAKTVLAKTVLAKTVSLQTYP